MPVPTRVPTGRRIGQNLDKPRSLSVLTNRPAGGSAVTHPGEQPTSLVIHALDADGVAELHVGGDQSCQRVGNVTVHSYPSVGGQGDPCACGETQRGTDQGGEDHDDL